MIITITEQFGVIRRKYKDKLMIITALNIIIFTIVS